MTKDISTYELIINYLNGNDSQITRLINRFKNIAFSVASTFDSREPEYIQKSIECLYKAIKGYRTAPESPEEVSHYANSIKKRVRALMNKEYGIAVPRIPEQDKQEMYARVNRFCDGEDSEIREIVEGYIPLAVSIAMKTKGPSVPKEEINAQAMYALTYAVHAFGKLTSRCPKALTNWIRTTVKRSLKDFINDYPLLKVPRTTQRDWTKTNKAEPPKQVEAEFMDEVAFFEETFNAIDGEMEGLILELDLSISELMILESLMEGLKQEEIADKVNIARETVTRKIRRIRNRAKWILLI